MTAVPFDSNLATKRDLKDLELELKRDLLATKRDLKDLELELKRDLKEMEYRLTIRLGGLIALAIVTVATLVKLL
jgi:hypothetical protein